jgi:L-serine dehydratase
VAESAIRWPAAIVRTVAGWAAAPGAGAGGAQHSDVAAPSWMETRVISTFDLFKIGIGPSSSHTVGPMRAAHTFVTGLKADGLLSDTARVRVELFGSLGATGHGHGSDRAVILGLAGEDPETVDTDTIGARIEAVRATGRLSLLGSHEIAFSVDDDVTLHRRRTLPFHPNGMTFAADYASGSVLRERTFYSVGGGFVVD